MSELITITINGEEAQVEPGQMLIKACEDTGTYIPRFCYHPRMNPVGMCRMCLVEVEGLRGIMLVPSCTMPVNDGMVVHTESETVVKAQEGILEFLLINHPLDCPVCDKGGECPLQDQTMACGPGESRFVEEKRHYEKPIPISDLVLLDRERCILCARCTKFSEEISGDPLIEFNSRGNDTQIQTFPDLPFSSYFSGNTVQICPVGALTAVPYRFRARPWDLQVVGSTCLHCTAGDSISVQASQNQVLRFMGVDNDATNHGWLTDKCRFGFEYLNSAERLTTPMIKNADGEFQEASWPEAITVVADRLGSIIEANGGESVAGIGGARGTNEDAYAFSKFMRTVISSNHVDAQLDDGLDAQFLAALAGKGKISDLESAKTILLWGPDLKEELGTLYLRVRRAAQELDATLIVVHPRGTGLDDRADYKYTYRPGSGFATLKQLAAGLEEFAGARAALGEGSVVAIVGRTGYTEDPRLAEAVAALVRDLPDSTVLPVARRGNVFGALDMGLAPTLLPGRVSVRSDTGRAELEEAWGQLPDHTGQSTAGIIAGLIGSDIKGLVLLGADPARDVPDAHLAKQALEAAEFIVAIDLFMNDSVAHADVVLPALGATEKNGTVTNLEGRVQRINRITPGPGQAREDWSILDDLSVALGAPMGLMSTETITKELCFVAPAYRGLTLEILEWGETDGAVVPYGDATQPLEYVPVDVGLATEEAAFVLHSARTLYDDGVMLRNGLSQHQLAPGVTVSLRTDDALSLGVSDGGVILVDDTELTVRIDNTLAPATAYVPFNQPDGPALGSKLEVKLKAKR